MTKPKPKKRKPLRKDAIDRLYEAVVEYVEERGGKLVVIGGVEIQDWFDGAAKFRVAIRCLGRPPKSAEKVSA